MNPAYSSEVRGAVQAAEPWIERIARFGYMAKGFVYVLIGALAIMPLVGLRGKATNPAGAIDEIARQPFGIFLLVAIGVGLSGYSLWRILQAIYNPTRAKWVKRIAYVFSAVAYGALAYLSLRATTGQHAVKGRGPDSGQIGITARLLEQPYGKYLVFALAAVVAAVGIAQLVTAVKASFKKQLKEDEMSPEELAGAVAAGRLGFASRGLIFLGMGWFLVKAAIDEDPARAKGFAGALKALIGAPYGPYVFGATALGLIAYGIFMFVMAKYRRMERV